MTAIALTLVLNSCTYIKLEDHHERYDLDGDGHIDMAMGGGDCNDDSDEVYPRATEICNQVDDDCDHTVDEGAGVRWYLDDDGDGYGRSDVHIKACDQPREDYVDDATDCDDSQEDVHPGAEEIWYDGTDQDCDMNDSELVFGQGAREWTGQNAGEKIRAKSGRTVPWRILHQFFQRTCPSLGLLSIR